MSKIQAKYLGDLRIEGEVNGHPLTTDVVKKFGGLEEYPTPTDLFAFSLATCMLTLIGIKGRALGVDVEGTTVNIEKKLDQTGQILGFNISFDCQKPIEEKFTERLEVAASHCPIHRILDPKIELNVEYHWEKTPPSSSKQD